MYAIGFSSLSKKYYFNFYTSCGSTYKIEFAKQFIKTGGVYLGFYTREEKMCPEDAVFLQHSIESVVSIERLLEKR